VLGLLSSAVDHEARHEDIRDKREDNTGSWIFETEQFKRWLDGPDSVLWCYGIRMETIFFTLYRVLVKADNSGMQKLAPEKHFSRECKFI
jgi:hypothetical protein